MAIFLAFQSQSWHTDDQTGHTIPDLPAPGPAPIPGPGEAGSPGAHRRGSGQPVGPAPERETVILLNTSAHDLDLGGWALLDRLKQRMPLDPITLPAGETVRIQLQPPLQLGNQGGLLTLLNLTIVDQCRGSAGRTTSASMQCQGLTLLGST